MSSRRSLRLLTAIHEQAPDPAVRGGAATGARFRVQRIRNTLFLLRPPYSVDIASGRFLVHCYSLFVHTSCFCACEI